MSFPAISQSVTIVNNDTLVCFPDQMVRQMIVDLEEGDFCKNEKESLYKNIKSYQNIITAKDSVVFDLNKTIANLNAKVKQKDRLIKLTETERDNAIKEKKMAFYKGIGVGAVPSLIILVLALL